MGQYVIIYELFNKINKNLFLIEQHQIVLFRTFLNVCAHCNDTKGLRWTALTLIITFWQLEITITLTSKTNLCLQKKIKTNIHCGPLKVKTIENKVKRAKNERWRSSSVSYVLRFASAFNRYLWWIRIKYSGHNQWAYWQCEIKCNGFFDWCWLLLSKFPIIFMLGKQNWCISKVCVFGLLAKNAWISCIPSFGATSSRQLFEANC